MTTLLPLPQIPAPSSRMENELRNAGTDLVDTFGRVATDLRVSLTDKCNLRCTYCMPASGVPTTANSALLTREELARLVSIAVNDLGVQQVRFTGGEPLLRKDLIGIISDTATLLPRPEISLTTNAIGLSETIENKSMAQRLVAAGLDRINISLDTLRDETFQQLTRRPHFAKTLDGIRAAHQAFTTPLKINSVLISEINHTEAVDLVDWALTNGYELRFIEQMPLDAGHTWRRDKLITAAEIKQWLTEKFILTLDTEPRNGAPAQRWKISDRPEAAHPIRSGYIGIIASVTEPFCQDCKRTRLTADGKVRNCLFTHRETDLLGPLRAGASDEELRTLWRNEMWRKESGHHIDDAGFVQPNRPMNAIGG